MNNVSPFPATILAPLFKELWIIQGGIWSIGFTPISHDINSDLRNVGIVISLTKATISNTKRTVRFNFLDVIKGGDVIKDSMEADVTIFLIKAIIKSHFASMANPKFDFGSVCHHGFWQFLQDVGVTWEWKTLTEFCNQSYVAYTLQVQKCENFLCDIYGTVAEPVMLTKLRNWFNRTKYF